MSATTRASNAPTSDKTATPKKANARVVTWDAVEYVPQKHWYWYVGLTLVGLWITGLFIYYGNWTGIILTALIVLAFYLAYLTPARTLHYHLDGTTLTIDGKKDSKDLNTYRASILLDLPTGKGNNPHYSLILLPKKKLGTTLEVLLPDSANATAIRRAIQKHAPNTTEDAYLGSIRILGTIARWLRLD